MHLKGAHIFVPMFVQGRFPKVFKDNDEYYINNPMNVFNKTTLVEFLQEVEKEFPSLIDYKMLSIKKERFGKINIKRQTFNRKVIEYS